MDKKPSVFISYNHSSSDLVQELVRRLDGIADVHWDKNVGHWESFTAFMNTIRKQDFAVLIISDLYLRSNACLYEVTQLMGVDDWDKKTLFIVEDSARIIFKPTGWIDYIDYWNDKLREFEAATAKYDGVDALRIEHEKLKVINSNIAEFLQKVADANNPDFWMAVDAVVNRLMISAKKNSANSLKNTIYKLIISGQNNVNDIAIATNRSRYTISRYLAILKKEGKIQVVGKGKNQRIERLV